MIYRPSAVAANNCFYFTPEPMFHCVRHQTIARLLARTRTPSSDDQRKGVCTASVHGCAWYHVSDAAGAAASDAGVGASDAGGDGGGGDDADVDCDYCLVFCAPLFLFFMDLGFELFSLADANHTPPPPSPNTPLMRSLLTPTYHLFPLKTYALCSKINNSVFDS